MMTVSGRVYFDAFGRTVTAYYPVTASAEAATIDDFIDLEDGIAPTTTTYDVLNRALTVTLPDNAVTRTEYGFAEDKFGIKQFSTKTTDANGKQTEQFTDVKGRVSSVKNYTAEKSVWTTFKYNAVNEQTEATDDLGHTTFSLYDNLGRRVERKHPDAGTSAYNYDLAGNLTELVTANLAKEGQAISYTYDFERLTEITYPQHPENNVKYTYGEPGASDNRAGKIVLQEDAAGAQEFFYGALGEVVKNIRTVVIPQHDEQTYVTEWEYDTWNRLLSMTYADGEKVTYNYNQGGSLRSMTGKKKNATYNYVNQIGYDKFEQRVFLGYGNGTKTNYSYEPERRRLEKMTAQTSAKRVFMDNVYEYDKVNNILSLKNNAPIPSPNLMGGTSEYNYSYDDLYRLTGAQGHYRGPNDEHTYTLAMSYNTVGGIIQKTQEHKRKDQEQKKTTYNLDYTYGSEQPHAPTHIGEQTFSYDANGNQTGWESDISGQRRKILWDEENRIRGIYDNGALYHYVYDASGERVLKGQSTGQRIFVNGEWKAGSGQMGNYTVYVNPYLVLRSGGYTKHYYIEGQRIASKLGGGWDNNGKGPLKAGEGKVDYVGKGQKVFDGIVKNLKFLGADGQILTAGKSGKIPPGQIRGTGGTVTEAFRYFYHPDQLGSTSYVTDASGEVFQHLEYFAFGETFVEEHSNTDRTPYLFNGKEMDEETGLYYFGARYQDPRTSIFLSVDRFAEKYSGLSPYQYAGNNPVSYIDINGDSTYLIIYGSGWENPSERGPGTHDLGDGLQRNAEVRADQLRQNLKAGDDVVVVYAATEDEYVDALNKSYASGVIKQLDVYSHGSDNSINLGGPESGPAEPRPGMLGHDRGKADYRMVSAWPSAWNPNGDAEISRISASNFSSNAVVNLWGCNLGGADRGSITTGASHAQYLANHLGRSVTVNAFNSSGSEFKTRSGVNVYDGTMIRSADVRTQTVRQTSFKPR
jgi:RHS repeat-associated protein